MNHRATIILLAGALLGASFVPASASACSGAVCDSPRLMAGIDVVVPANAPGLAVAPSALGAIPETLSVRLREVGAGEPVDVPSAVIDGMVVPLEGFEEGAIYELELTAICADEPMVGLATIYVIEGASFPETLGQVVNEWTEIAGQVPVPDSGGSCYANVSATYADVSIELDPSAEAWAHLFVWETLVDGEPYAPSGSYSPRNGYGLPSGYMHDPAGSWVGRGRDRIYTACDTFTLDTSDEGVGAGVHEVMFRGHIPGTDIVVESGVGLVELECNRYPEDPYCPDGYMDTYSGECHPYPHDDVCAHYDPTYSSECPGYGDDYGEWEEGGWFGFGCSSTGAAPASRGTFGFAFLMLGAIVAFRRRRRRS